MSEPTRPRGASDKTRRALHAAVEAGDHSGLTTLLGEHPGFVDALDLEGRSLLLRAVERGDFTSAEVLLKAGASASAHAATGSALEIAAGRSDAALVELLLDHGARELRVAFRIASERKARPIMEMLAHREPTLQLSMEFDAEIPDQKLVNTELLTRRLLDPVLSLGAHVVHLSWDGVRNTYLETLPGRPDRAFSVEVQQRVRLLTGETELGQVDGMWYMAIVSGPARPVQELAHERWRVRYAYYATAGAYQHYSAVDLTFDFAKNRLEVAEVPEPDQE